MTVKTITPAQSRAARGLLNWTQRDLADKARIGPATMARFEGARGAMIANNFAAVIRAFERAGIEFLPEGADGGEGVRMRRHPQ